MKKPMDPIKSAENRRLMILFCYLFLMVMLVGCGNNEPIRIGFIGSLSGPNSDLSVSGYRGVEMAITKLNAAGGVSGRRLELVVKDDQNNPELGKRAKLELDGDGIGIIVGPYTSGIAMAIMESKSMAHGLLLGPTISADALSGKDDNFMRFTASTKEQATILAQFVKSKKGTQTTIIYDVRNRGFSDPLMEHYESIMRVNSDHEIIEIPVDPSNAGSFKDAVDKVIAKKTDYLLILSGAEDFARFAQKMKSHLPDVQLLGPLWANTPQLIRKGGHHVDGTVVVSGINPRASVELKGFMDDYETTYGEKPTFSSIYSYETIMALNEAMKGLKNPSPLEVKKRLIEIHSFKGIQGSFSLDAYGDNTRVYYLNKVENGRLNEVK